MTSLIQNLDRDSLLMLYQAGELSEQDWSEVETMLSRDPSLRMAHNEIMASHVAMTTAIGVADALLPLPAPQASSVRRVAAGMAQWRVDRLTAKPVRAVGNLRRFAWAYAAAAMAAMILVTVFVLWSRVDDGRNDPVAGIFGSQGNATESQQDSGAADVNPETERADAYTPAADADSQLSRVEGDLYTLSTLTDSLRADALPDSLRSDSDSGTP